MERIPNNEIRQAIYSNPLMGSFIIHFFLITFGVQGYWSPDSYLFYNLIFLATLLWSINSPNANVIILCFVINLSSILFDIIALSVYFPRETFGSADRFSAGMAILNLVIRPLSCIGLFKVISSGLNAERNDPEYEGIRGYNGQ